MICIAQSAQWYRFTVTLSPSPGAVLAHKSTEHACGKGHRGVPIPDRCRPVDGWKLSACGNEAKKPATRTIGRGVESLLSRSGPYSP